MLICIAQRKTNKIRKRLIHIALSVIGLIHCNPTHAQDFPNALALIEYLNGVNSSKVPKILEADVNIMYFTDSHGPEHDLQTFITGESQFVSYDLPVGINAKVHIKDSLVIILKSERVFETKRIDVENFLMFGIHKNDPKESIVTLNKLGINTGIIDDAIRLGRPMWVIGAYRREANTPQLWIDKELLVVKKVHYINLPQQKIEQLEWDDFERVGDFYIPLKCEFRSDPEILYRLERKNLNCPDEISEKIKKLINF